MLGVEEIVLWWQKGFVVEEKFLEGSSSFASVDGSFRLEDQRAARERAAARH